ncbi:DUF1295 domain-containing protein [Nocardioides terrisoli]|uniref:DUF1295 domain-containing protein n=1 Tax=Nocardioides terrisoli TaxID=3388267 RepID=UPI00287BC8EC|nr:DUF1295 domain-containing protein [Nocardioides marmorisolisilvae]
MTGLWLVSGSTAALAVLAMALTAVAARRAGRVSVVDTTWGIALTVTAVLAAVLGALVGDGDHWRSVLLVVLTAIWGLRLSWHVGSRSGGAGEDPRYADLLARGPGGALRKVWLPQGAAIWLVSLPLQVAAVTSARGPATPALVGVGCAVWLAGVAFEAIGDAQLAAYKRDPDRGPVMDRGLWRYTRHPNYFGDACVWWGIWLVAASAWPGVLTVVSPLAMTWFLAFVTGAKLLEETMMKRPGYPEYAARTSMFVPLPPKR